MKLCRGILAIFVFALGISTAAIAGNVMAFSAPQSKYAPNWTAFQTYVVPHISGIAEMCDWSKIETSQGVYDFSSCDKQFTNYVGTPLKFGIVMAPISFNSNTYTPAYVYSASYAQSLGVKQLDYCTCNGSPGGYPGSGKTKINTCAHAGDTTAYPAVWEVPFQTAYRAFIAAAMAHFNSVSWKSQIAYVRFGRSSGGETNDRCETQLISLTGSIDNLQADWVGNAQGNDTFEAKQPHTFPLQNSVACSNAGGCGWADEEAATATSLGIGIGSEGVSNLDITRYNEDRPGDADWIHLFDTYANLGLVQQTQTLGQSNPSGQGQVGSLVPLMPFETQHHANTMELYIQDLYCAYVPGYHDSTGCPSGYAPYVPYQKAIAAAEE